jgi:hypothetical protein
MQRFDIQREQHETQPPADCQSEIPIHFPPHVMTEDFEGPRPTLFRKRLVKSREPLFLMYWPPVHCGVMSDTVIEERTTNPKADEWAEHRCATAQRNVGEAVL